MNHKSAEHCLSRASWQSSYIELVSQFHYGYLKNTHVHTRSHTWAPLCKFYYADCRLGTISKNHYQRSLLLISLELLKNKHQLHILPWLLERSKVVKRHTLNLQNEIRCPENYSSYLHFKKIIFSSKGKNYKTQTIYWRGSCFFHPHPSFLWCWGK